MLVKTPKHLDRIDRNILIQLQKNGRISNVELAKEVGLSPSPCLERVKRLESQGYIKGYHADVDPEKLGAAMLVFVEITLTKTSVDIFAEFSASIDNIEINGIDFIRLEKNLIIEFRVFIRPIKGLEKVWSQMRVHLK